MARLKRFTIDDGNYHILVRGHNKRKVFHCEDDFRKYLELMKINKFKFNIKIYHYSLMENHIHVILNAPNGEYLVKMMHMVNQKYAQYYRKRYGGYGYVWQDRYKSFLIENGRYLLVAGRYVEINPVIAGIVKFPYEYKWNSYHAYVLEQKNDIIDFSPEYLGLAEKEENRKRIYKDFIMDGIKEKEKREEERFFKEGAYGSKEFVERLKADGLKQTWSHPGRPWNKGKF